jgi:hypothetical protein
MSFNETLALLNEAIDKEQLVLRKLLQQIALSNYIEENGHSLTMNKAFWDACEHLGYSSRDEAIEALKAEGVN